jgi:ribosomal protein S18 acetylase RimI-like enzyme
MNPSGLAVRPGAPDDEDSVVAANLAMALETEDLVLNAEVLRRGVRRALSAPPDCRYFIAQPAAGGDPVGQLMVTREWSDWRDAWVWWIQSVYVWPAHRGNGVYRRLYAAVLAEAAAAGVPVVRLYVDTRNTSAQATYAALGMDGGHYQVFEATLPSPAAEGTEQTRS